MGALAGLWATLLGGALKLLHAALEAQKPPNSKIRAAARS
jgi:hypothetical protein